MKSDYLGSALRAGAIVGMQEVHGSAVRLRILIDRTGLDYQMFYSFDDGADESIGGVATIFPYLPRVGLDVRKTSEVRARVLRVTASITTGRFQGYTLKHWNIHDHDLSREQVARISTAIKGDLRDMEQGPQRCCVVLVGDINYGENVEVEDPLVQGGGRRAAAVPGGGGHSCG